MGKVRESIEGFCADCKEWTEVDAEQNGCCDMGCYAEGGHWTSEDFETDEDETAEPIVVLPRGVA
jgi:hypothetical protein